MKICPKCGSEDISKSGSDLLGFLGGSPTYVCENCGYKGKLFLEIDSDMAEEAKETIEEKDIPEAVDFKSPFSWSRFTIGIIFILMGIPIILYYPLGGTFFIGAVSALIGLALLHGEIKKLNV